MAIDFPGSPSTGQRHSHNNTTWEWDGSSWNRITIDLYTTDATTVVGLAVTQFARRDDDNIITGVTTFIGNGYTGVGNTVLIVEGDARVTGVLSVGQGSVSINERDIYAVGVVTGANFKTGTTNVHNVGVEAAGINVLGADTPIGTGATVYNSGLIVSKAGAEYQGVVTAATFKGAVEGNVTGNVSGSSGSSTGNAATATALQNARTIGGVSFDGTANINLPGVNQAGNQNTTGTAALSEGLTGTPDITVRNITVTGIQTAEDVKNIDSVGIITARTGIDVTGGTFKADGLVGAAGSVLSTTGSGIHWVSPLTGPQGAQGRQGAQGHQGAAGVTGAQGVQGTAGSSGGTGAQGVQGAQGHQGVQGAQGHQGVQGAQGHQGVQGAQGHQGHQGVQGAQGHQGVQGAQGRQGAQGVQGAQGIQGAEGNFGGATFYYTFESNTTNANPGAGDLRLDNSTQNAATGIYICDTDEDGNDIASYLQTIDDSTSTIKGHVKISNKLDSSQFILFTISSLTDNTGYFDVTVSPVDSSATNPFSANEDIIITFARTGDKGATGAQGVQGAQGHQGVQGAQGRQGAQGVQGATGNTGAQGHQGVQGAGGSTGAQGHQGRQGAAGAQGATGSTGAAGAQGSQGHQGVQGAGGLTTTDASTLQGSPKSSFPLLSSSNSFTNGYNEFGNSTGNVSNDGSWNARLNLAGSTHARFDVKSVSDGIITTMYAHTGHSTGKVGTLSNHGLTLMCNGNSRAELSTSGSLSTTVQGTLWGASNDGSGSGLDADLLDGLHAGSFLRSDANDSYSSGTLSIHGMQFQAGNTSQNLKLKGNTGTDVGLSLYESNNTWVCQLYGTSAGQYGFLNSNWGSWDLKKTPNGQMELRVGSSNYTVYHTGNIGDNDVTFSGGSGAITIGANSDIRLTNGNWTGDSCKLQHHSNYLYVQGGSNGIFLRASDGTNSMYTHNNLIRSYVDHHFQSGAGAITIEGNSDIRFTNGTWTGESCKIQHHSNWLYIQGGSNGHVFRRSSGNDAWYINGSGVLYPAADSTYDLGTNTSRIKDIFADHLALGDNGGSPGARLAIQHDSGYNIYLEGNGWSGEAGIGFGGYGAGNGVADGSTAARIGATSSAPGGQAVGYLSFYTNPGDNLTERVRIRSNGDLNIRSNDVSSMTNSEQRLRFSTHQTNGQSASTAAIVGKGVSGWGGNLEFWTKDNNGTPDETLRHTMTLQGDNHRMYMYGDIHFDGDVTTTNQNRQIYWTGFDKEGTSDYTDVAGIEHTTNTGGHSGSVLKIRVSNDAGDGIYLDATGGVNIANTLRMNSGNIQPRADQNSIRWQNDAFGGGGDYARIDYYRDGSGEDTRLRIQIENDNADDLRLEAGTIRAEGSFSASSKNFTIPHPNTSAGISTTHNLSHSSIEGPQVDLIYRGKVDLVGGTASINIDTKAGMAEGTFVILCKDIQCFTSNETGWGAVKGSVSGNILTITAQDNSSTDTISWMVIGERQDPTIKNSNCTDDDGNFIVQPPKDKFELNGILPSLPTMNGAQQIT